MKLTFIYALVDPRTRAIRYVGKANDPKKRLTSHINSDKECNSRKRRWIEELSLEGLIPEIQIVEECSARVWREREIFWIAEMRRRGHELTNTADGGDGTCCVLKRTRMAISAASIGVPNTGRCAKGVPRPWQKRTGRRGMPSTGRNAKGVPHGPSSGLAAKGMPARGMNAKGVPKPRVSAALTGRKLSPEHVAKSAASNRGKKRSVEFVARMKLLIKFSPKAIAGRESLKGRKQTLESNLKRSVAASVSVLQIDKATGSVVAKYPSFTAAGKAVLRSQSAISGAISRRGACAGFYWKPELIP